MPKHRVCRGLAAVLLCFLALVGGLVLALRAALPDTFYTAETELRIASMPWVTVQHKQESVAQAGNANEDKSRNVTLSLFGTIPLKTVRTVNVETRSVQVCGTPFGVKMFSDGALVVAFSDQYTNLGTENPAKEAGLKLGDLIVSAGGHAVRSNEELTQAITDAAGKAIPIVYQRDGIQHTTMLTPVQDVSTGAYRAGLWVRDSSAGIGTMTFLDPLNGTFAGLGHAISDTDTGADITLLSGEIVPVVITGCVSGTAGSPGELRGEFSAAAAGTVLANDSTGVYGEYLAAMSGQSCPVMQPQEIALGDAEIWTTISGSTPRAYSVRIEQVNMTSSDPNRNLLVKVTDPELLAATGGIVRGMSGSPIVQNGRLVGAVTHVLVNDPTRGYGIFATTMLEKADSLP
ncbi:SpoIVB peptidase [Subdoligranulum variabile]|uniref:SpoIVB peptidase n=1 Tax=Subdoligranulum variabile TaxID=214851 RepID=UPI002943B672|nr:SpoIVB peptidase [Subdoligranulum variabile]